MQTRFKKGAKVFDIVITAVAGMLSVGMTVLLLCMLTFFYARKNWKSYSKGNLWAICVIDMIIAALYNVAIYLEPTSEYTNYMMTEI